jgi:site-specific DNA-methyltransferase (adenine-specific)/modification methylase
MIEFNTIYNEDCLETMKRMPDKSVDAIVTSPPYNLRLNSNGTGYKERGKTSAYSGKYDSFSDALPMNEYRDYHSQIINEMCRVSKVVFWNIQIVTGNKDAVFQILGSHFAQVRDVVVWDKGHGQL